MSHFSLTVFRVGSLSLSFGSFIILCLYVGLFEFILFGICWAFWMFIFMFFTNLICFQPLSSQIISLPLSLSLLLLGAPTMHKLVWLTVFHRCLRLCLLFINLFPFISSVDLNKQKGSYLTNKMALFGTSKGIAIWDKQARVNHRQVQRTEEKGLLL